MSYFNGRLPVFTGQFRPVEQQLKDIRKSINVQIKAGELDIAVYDLKTFLELIKQAKIIDDDAIFIIEMNQIIIDEVHRARDAILSTFTPLIRVDTGAMRASFVNNIKIKTEKVQADITDYYIIFDLNNWLTEIPYAKFYISEIAATGDTKNVVSVELIKQLMLKALENILIRINARGYTLEMASQNISGGIEILEKALEL
jgi:hypothetical protein